jgi:hypothetical protein
MPKVNPEATPPLPETLPAVTGNPSGAPHLEIAHLLARSSYSHTSLPSAESFTSDASRQDSECDTDFDSDMLPDDGTSTG